MNEKEEATLTVPKGHVGLVLAPDGTVTSAAMPYEEGNEDREVTVADMIAAALMCANPPTGKPSKECRAARDALVAAIVSVTEAPAK